MRNKKGTLKAHISTQRAIDRQSGGNHYKNLKYQVSEFILGNELNWIDANIVIHYAELGKDLIKE